MTNLSRFDQSKVEWQPLPDVDHVWLSILNVDDTAKIVDVLFKYGDERHARLIANRICNERKENLILRAVKFDWNINTGLNL